MSATKYKIGDKISHLTIIKDTWKRRSSNGAVFWLCQCDCGKQVIRSTSSLSLSTKLNCEVSCGCVLDRLRKDMNIGAIYAQDKNRIEKAKESLGQYKGTTMQGIQRLSLNKNNTTGHIGVGLCKNGTYRARIMLNGKEHSVCGLKTLEEAVEKRKELEEKYFTPIIEEYDDLYGKYRKKKRIK